MGVEVKLTSQGHLPLDDVRDALEGMRAGPVTYKVTEYMEGEDTPAVLATFSFKDPTDRRRNREMRLHHWLHPSEKAQAHVSGDEYSYLVMGAHGGGPEVIRSMAERYGGLLEDERDETEEAFPYPGAPAP